MTDVSFDALAAMWRDRDPLPAGLVERVLVGLALERLDEEYELLHLVERSHQLVGTRREAESPLSISFVGDEMSVLLRVSHVGEERRIDGWVAPARPGRVTLRGLHDEWQTVVDGNGRFEIVRVSAGLVRIFVETPPTDGGSDTSSLFITPAVEL